MADLILLTEYKAYEGISSTQHDARLEKIIDSVSQLVKNYCGNSIVDHYSSVKTEYFNIDWDTHVVQLTESPVNVVNQIATRDNVSADYVSLSSSQYYLDTPTDSIFRVNTGGNTYRNFPKGPGAVKVQYTAGYSTCPKDLQIAVADLVTYYFKNEQATRRTLSGATIENQGTGATAGFPDHIKRVLDMYKNF